MRGEKIFITCLLSTPSCWAFSNSYRRQARVSISLHDSLLSSTGSQLIYSDLDNDDWNIDSRHVNNRHAAGDWLHNIASLPNSSVLREIRNPVLSITAWSTAVSIVHKSLSTSTQTSALKIASDMCIGSQVHSFMVSSLGLLLVFRTNSAYQRFMEGRKIWEQIHSVSRNLTRLLTIYEKEIGKARLSSIKNVLASFPYLLRNHVKPKCLRCKNDVPPEHRLNLDEFHIENAESCQDGECGNGELCYPHTDENSAPYMVDDRTYPWSLLPTVARKQCAVAKNRPLWACNRMTLDISSIEYGPNFTSRERLTMIGHVDKLSNAIGECERIHRTAVPLNYARHSLRSLTLWLFTLPFALTKELGLMTGPVCGIAAWLMFGVYQIGHSIEDPFQKSLRLSILCNVIRKDILDIWKHKEPLSDKWSDEDWFRVNPDNQKDFTSATDLITNLP